MTYTLELSKTLNNYNQHVKSLIEKMNKMNKHIRNCSKEMET